MVVFLDLERASTALPAVIAQMIGPLAAPFVDHAFLDHIGGRIGQRLEKVGGLRAHNQLNGLGIDNFNTIADQCADLILHAFARILKLAQIDQRHAVEVCEIWRERSVEAVCDIAGRQWLAITELEAGT